MSQVFISTVDGWDVEPLERKGYSLRYAEGGVETAPWDEQERGGAPADALLLLACNGAEGSGKGWALITDGSVRLLVNGGPVALGIALLRDRDELRVGSAAPVYFSTERLARVEACEREDEPRCPRCASSIARGELSVRCPSCQVLHHQRVGRECWTYLAKCALCDQPTDLAAGLRWTPEGF
jgi:hypothetical protein